MREPIVSEVPGFKGKVYLPDFLTMPQVVPFARAQREITRIIDESAETPKSMPAWERDLIIAPALFACILKMEVEGQPEHPTLETFRFTPAPRADEFLDQIIAAVALIVVREQEIPNALKPVSIATAKAPALRRKK